MPIPFEEVSPEKGTIPDHYSKNVCVRSCPLSCSRRRTLFNVRFLGFSILTTLRPKHLLHWPCFITLPTLTKFRLLWRQLCLVVVESAATSLLGFSVHTEYTVSFLFPPDQYRTPTAPTTTRLKPAAAAAAAAAARHTRHTKTTAPHPGSERQRRPTCSA